MAAGRDLRAEAFEVTVETLAQRGAFRRVGSGLGHHDEVPRRERTVEPKGLARQALEAIAVDRPLRNTTRDREPEPRDVTRVRAREHGEEAIARADRIREDSAELLRRVQALPGREPRGARRDR
jgi:hypothetical protein